MNQKSIKSPMTLVSYLFAHCLINVCCFRNQIMYRLSAHKYILWLLPCLELPNGSIYNYKKIAWSSVLGVTGPDDHLWYLRRPRNQKYNFTRFLINWDLGHSSHTTSWSNTLQSYLISKCEFLTELSPWQMNGKHFHKGRTNLPKTEPKQFCILGIIASVKVEGTCLGFSHHHGNGSTLWHTDRHYILPANVMLFW